MSWDAWDAQMMGEAELSTDHHGWIRWQGRLTNTPGKLKPVVSMHWNLRGLRHLQKNFSCIPGEVGDMESKRATFKASIMEVAGRSCGLKVISACVAAT